MDGLIRNDEKIFFHFMVEYSLYIKSYFEEGAYVGRMGDAVDRLTTLSPGACLPMSYRHESFRPFLKPKLSPPLLGDKGYKLFPTQCSCPQGKSIAAEAGSQGNASSREKPNPC
ncbi:hypothetical protein QQP08_000602 [Theobroma cacao]|nr:hypothetical protein QQP08_000602 [Theobroma cacao]